MSPQQSSTPSDQSSPPPNPGSATAAPPAPPFGWFIVFLSREFGIACHDVALLVAAVLGNIAGGFAGLSMGDGRTIPPGINILLKDGPSLRTRRLLNYLLNPVQRLQNLLRARATAQIRGLVDIMTFGPKSLSVDGLKECVVEGARERALEARADLKQMLKETDSLRQDKWGPDGQSPWDDVLLGSPAVIQKRQPGSMHLPTFLFEGGEVGALAGALEEAHDHELFVLDLNCRLFASGRITRSTAGKGAAPALASLLAGEDRPFKPLHPQQGHGSLQRASVKLMSTIPLDVLGQALEAPESDITSVLKQCILLDPVPCEIQPCGHGTAREAWAHYTQVLRWVIDARLQRERLGVSPPREHHDLLAQHEKRFIEALEQTAPEDGCQEQAFAQLQLQLLWALLLLEDPKEPRLPGTAASAAANHAVQQHSRLMREAREQARRKALEKDLNWLRSTLNQHPPSTMREIQRRSNNRTKAELEPLLQRLIEDGQATIDEANRYHLIARKGERVPTATPQSSTAP